MTKSNLVINCKVLGQGSGRQPPEGPKARGPTSFTRTYPLKKCPGQWMYVVADCDLSFEFESEFESIEEAEIKLQKRGILAVPVLSCKKMAEYCLTNGSITACFEKRENQGLKTGTWKPTWIAYDDQPLDHPGAVAPTGVDRLEILESVLEMDKAKVSQLRQNGDVREDYWIDCKN